MMDSSESTASTESSGETDRSWPGPEHLTPALDPLSSVPAEGVSKGLGSAYVCDFSAQRITLQLRSHGDHCGSQSRAGPR